MPGPDVDLTGYDGEAETVLEICMKAAKDAAWTKAQRELVLGELSDCFYRGWVVFIAKVAEHFTIL